ncbi:SPASM domain-containing protein [Streptomyces sp. NPDC087263]|uniref:SPASM domain-containing protein n=1 Tax=Streptomyces sp. NPDC087263 TaxID=3365773 RepID=UPI00380D20D7
MYTIQFCRRLERAVGQQKCGRSVVHVNSLGDVDPCSNCVSGQRYRAGTMTTRSFAQIGEHGFDEFRDIRFNDHSACGPCPVAHEDVWCQFRCPPPARNTPPATPGAAARPSTCISGRYWSRRKQRNVRLTASPSSVTSQPPHSPPTVQGGSRGRRP